MSEIELKYTRIVAEFMGYPTNHYWWHHRDIEALNNTGLPMSLNENICKFHESYDWLMPVWVKFRDLDMNFSFERTEREVIYESHIERIKYAMMYSDTTKEPFIKLAEAIKWYNENN